VLIETPLKRESISAADSVALERAELSNLPVLGPGENWNGGDNIADIERLSAIDDAHNMSDTDILSRVKWTS
jgi:hypothetical protein